MNRSERRSGRWMTLNPTQDYDRFTAVAGEDSRKVMMVLLRQLVGPDAPFDDRMLWNAVRELINAGLLAVYFRQTADGYEIWPEFLIPSDNDNGRKAGAA